MSRVTAGSGRSEDGYHFECSDAGEKCTRHGDEGSSTYTIYFRGSKLREIDRLDSAGITNEGIEYMYDRVSENRAKLEKQRCARDAVRK